VDQANLAAIRTMIGAFPGLAIGYPDHTIGPQAAVLAVALGARIIEKHFTLDTAFSDFRDHQLSADPPALTALVQAVRQTEAMLGDGTLGAMPCEGLMVPAVRRSVVAARDLAAGETISADDITWVRPGGGVSPGGEDQVVGKQLRQAIAQGDMIKPESLD
jgi:N,N'-diacetyllegionaminate synthase